MLKATLDTRSLSRAIAGLKRRAPAAIARSLNRGAVAAQTKLVRDVQGDMRLTKTGLVKARTALTRATAAKPTATLSADAKPIPAFDFRAKGPYPSRGRGKGVSTSLPSGRIPNAWLAVMRGGRKGVYVRAGAARGPVHELTGPSIAHVSRKHAPAALERGEEQLIKTLRHEIERALKGSAQ